MTNNPTLKFAVEALLNKANSRGDAVLGATAFNKMVFLLYKRLKRKGKQLDLRLPYCWYLWGPFIAHAEFEHEVGVPLDYYVPKGEHTRVIDNVSDVEIPIAEKRLIEKEIDKMLAEFDNNGIINLDLLLNRAYELAPYEFQKVFNRSFRPELNKLRSYSVSKEEIEAYLDRLLETYPEKEMEELYDVFLEWDDTFRLALENDTSRTYVLAEEFWGFFCKLLRVKQRYGVSRDTIINWSFSFKESLHQYENKLENERNDLLGIHFEKEQTDVKVQRIVGDVMELSHKIAIEYKPVKEV